MKVVNRQAKFDYELKDRIEAGIVLIGPEVKSAMHGHVDMSHAHVKFLKSPHHAQQEAWVIGLNIFPYIHADNTHYDPLRTRKLLLQQKEILLLQNKMKQGRLLLVPTAMYTKSGKIKLELALARGKRKYEKRDSIKKRDLEREASR